MLRTLTLPYPSHDARHTLISQPETLVLFQVCECGGQCISNRVTDLPGGRGLGFHPFTECGIGDVLSDTLAELRWRGVVFSL